ncbi:hypothetical protein RQ832_02945, partial [Roseomonas sp. DSM 102946]|nr:hypothetical protein [Roseomonas sp. DSM 102946]
MTKRQKPDAGHPEPKSPRTKFDEMSLDAKINRAGAKIIRQREAKGLPSIADALQKNLSTNIGAAPYTHTPALSHTALCESLF